MSAVEMIKTAIARIKSAKEKLKAWLTSNGVTVPDGTKLDGMVDMLNDVSVSGGGDDFEIVNASYLFAYGSRDDIIDKLLPHVKRPTNMNNMFLACKKINELDVSGIDTSGVTDMSFLFSGCLSLTSIDLSGFDTSKATNMSSMFKACNSLKSIDLSGFDTSKATNMSSMFYGCKAITSIDVSKFDTSNVTNMGYMFQSMQAVKVIDVSNFDTTKASKMSGIFDYCSALEEILGFSACYGSGMSIGFPKGSYSETYALRRLTFRNDLPDGKYSIRSNIDIGYCSFDRSGMVEMFESLPDLNGSGVSTSNRKITITANPCVKDKSLTSSDRAIATSKGWTLVE